MKSSHPLSLVLALFALATAGAQGQVGQSWTGGPGTWDVGVTPDWNGTVWTNGNQAVFTTTPGSITVASGGVSSDQLYFGSGTGNWILTGGDITESSNAANHYIVYTAPGNTSNVTINDNIVLTYASNNQGQHFQNNGTGTLTFNGTISLSGAPVGGTYQQYLFDGNAAAIPSIVFNGAVSSTLPGSETDIGLGGGSAGAQYVFGTGANFSGMGSVNLGNGTVLLQSTNIGQTILVEYGAASILTDGAINYTGNLYERVNNTVLTVGGATADNSSFSGSLHVDDGASLTVTEVAGGQVTLNGDINGTLGKGLVKTGSGTVIINGLAGGGLNYNSGTTAVATLQAGTTLITNTSHSAFGNSGGPVNINPGATLGGSGISTQMVVASDSTSVIAPGASASAATTLHLNGGLTEENGLTLNFNLSGDSSDRIDFNGASMFVDGPLTLNLFGTPTINDANAGRFLLLSRFGFDSTGDPSSFVVNAPAGYTVVDTGVLLDANLTSTDYYVDLAASPTPEPSTYAMILGGVVFLGFCVRLKRI